MTNCGARDLEKAVEDLSELLEQPIDAETIGALRQKVTDKAVSVEYELREIRHVAEPWESLRSTCRRGTRSCSRIPLRVILRVAGSGMRLWTASINCSFFFDVYTTHTCIITSAVAPSLAFSECLFAAECPTHKAEAP